MTGGAEGSERFEEFDGSEGSDGFGGSEGFEAHRDHLTAVAYRMLGSRSDAEDAVQEAWLRWHATQAEIRDLRAWLTTVTARICLDQLRSARARRETYVGQWLPEPVVDRLPGARPGADPDPADRVARDDEVSYALLVVLERLSPEQRVAFVLHDAFGVPFDEVAAVLGSSPAAARQHASRARRELHADTPPRRPGHRPDLAEQRRAVAAFLAAARTGDLDGLLAVLAPDVVAVGDGGGRAPAAPRPVVGAVPVARFLAGLFRRYARDAGATHLEEVLVNGDLGLLLEVRLPDGTRLRSALAFAVADGRITGVFNQLNPAKLGHVPPPDPRRALPDHGPGAAGPSNQ